MNQRPNRPTAKTAEAPIVEALIVEAPLHYAKKIFLAKKEIMNQMDPLVEVLVNVKDILKLISEKYTLDGEYLAEWTTNEIVTPVLVAEPVEEDEE